MFYSFLENSRWFLCLVVLHKHAMECVHLLHFANGACAVVHLHPYHQPVFVASSHLIEELQTLKLPLGVEGSGFQ